MAIWKDSSTPRKDDAPVTLDPVAKREPELRPDYQASHRTPPVSAARDAREAFITPDLTIEGTIAGAGDIRIAGTFKGDVHVQGNLTIEAGAKLTGGVRADTVTIGGEVEGNITDAARVELLATGVLNGDLKAGSLTVAAGSRMRGQVQFGWDDAVAPRLNVKTGPGTAA